VQLGTKNKLIDFEVKRSKQGHSETTNVQI